MATLHEYFRKDFPRSISFSKECVLKDVEGRPLTFLVRLIADYSTNSKLFSFYFEPIGNHIVIFEEILNRIQDFFQMLEGDLKVHDLFGTVSLNDNWISMARDLKFTGRVNFYYNGIINREQFLRLQAEVKNKGVFVQCYDLPLAIERNEKQKPLAFISHDSRDKDFAREIAIGLEKRMCTVWFDEFTLEVGAPLRESIEKGLLECKKCVLLLSPNFISNEGWTKIEFNTIFTREIIETKKLVLPVWYNVDGNSVFRYCPTLKDRVGVNADKGLEFVIEKLHRSIILNN